jgi:hypothetical protein
MSEACTPEGTHPDNSPLFHPSGVCPQPGLESAFPLRRTTE